MTQQKDKATLLSLQFTLRQNIEIEFAAWRANFNGCVAIYTGFVSLEFFKMDNAFRSWRVVLRFANNLALLEWRKSEIYRDLLTDLNQFVQEQSVLEKIEEESDSSHNTTELFIAEPKPEKLSEFLKWRTKLHQIEGTFPGFRGAYLQSPAEGVSKYWISLLQFDTKEHQEQWLQSEERRKLMSEGSSLFFYTESHKVISPYQGWFASISQGGDKPSIVKETMIVLLVLYPIVMLQVRYLWPHLSGLHPAAAMFFANIMSVVLISYPFMPLAIHCLSWWLKPPIHNRLMLNIAGLLILGLLYTLELLFFIYF